MPLNETEVPRPMLLGTALVTLVAFFAAILIRWPDNFFADDSYFYFQVASRFAHGQGSSFNNLMPTNGYHPLWMLVCAGIFRLVPEKHAAVHAIGAVISLLNLGALTWLTLLLRRLGVWLPFLAWLLYLPFCFTTQLGTEGALSGFFLAATVLAAYRLALMPVPLRAGLFALCAALAVLSRLDNIFVIAAVSVALVLGVDAAQRRGMLRLLVMVSPVALLLWGTYLWSNHHWFGTWQPISGLLKAHSPGDHRLGSNLPHVAWFDLGLSALCLAVVSRLRRDLFFRVVEAPFACGVVLHAVYIVFVLSSETRWSWYYTSWTLLASILLARAGSAIFERIGSVFGGDVRRRTWQAGLFTLVYLGLLGVWSVASLRRFGHNDPAAQDPGFQANVVERGGLRTLLAFDKPGRIAYYSTAEIVPLDGLMGTLRFQKDLAARGVAVFDREEHVDGLIGPPQPMDDAGKRQFCDAVFLSSVQFHCVPAGPGQWTVDRVEIFARLTGTSAGVLGLAPSSMVWSRPGYVAAWRILPRTAE